MSSTVSDDEIDSVISEILAETQWKEEKQSVSDFMSGFNSAQVIRLISRGRDLDLSPADILHPFLAFSRRRRTKVYAENLVWDKNENKYTRKGPILEIPKDYVGWFEVEGKGWKANHSCHASIADVAKMKCKQFLVRTTVVGHLAADNNNDADDGDFQVGPEVRIYPGDILTICDVITKKWKVQSIGGATDKKAKALLTKFLQCVDGQQRLVYLPFGHPGEFYPLWDSDSKSKSPHKDYAYYIHDMIGFGFPLVVRVVFGWPPADMPEFGGLLRLMGVGRPDTLVLRNLKPGGCVITELPMDSDVKIEKMDNLEMLINNHAFERLLSHSCDRIYPYLIGMKHMETRYPVYVPPDDNENTEPNSPEPTPTNQDKDRSRMAKPRDMKVFDTMDIFPPLEEPIRQVADSWTLSFKDPEYSSKNSDLRDAESVIIDPKADDTAVASALKGIKVHDPLPERRDPIWQRRTKMEHEYEEREADC